MTCGSHVEQDLSCGRACACRCTLSDGITNAYSNVEGSVISQTVGETVVMGEVYTLLIDIGWRFDESFTGTADLLINGHTYAAAGTTIMCGWTGPWVRAACPKERCRLRLP